MREWNEYVQKYVEDEDELEQLTDRIKNSTEWDQWDCERLCDLAGLHDEWAASDGETFLQVVEKAADILGVEIY